MGDLKFDYASAKVNSIQGRYIIKKDVEAFLASIAGKIHVQMAGTSVRGNDIDVVTLGAGKTKILMWSQMHGNETTTTKAVLDFMNYLNVPSENADNILSNCTIKIIPILNPDGALVYTRVNANEVDLNRDAKNLSQPESKVLRKVYDTFKPHFCYNLHDQRTIYNVGNTNKPATVSFLAPAHDKERNISLTRADSMKLIVAMNESLQQAIPGQVGRYDDSFNINCVGDSFQSLNTPTVLFEAGHFPSDYQRETTRELIFTALLSGVNTIANDELGKHKTDEYFSIPENDKLFFDVLIKNTHLFKSTYKKGEGIGILYKETLNDGTINFEPYIESKGNLDNYFGHLTYDGSNADDLEALKNHKSIFETII